MSFDYLTCIATVLIKIWNISVTQARSLVPLPTPSGTQPLTTIPLL